MPALPWITPNPAPPDGTTVVMASRFEVRSLTNVPLFFLKSLVAWKQVRSAPGVFGASLIAQPTKRVFFTLSAWESRDALYAYARTEPHRDIMKLLKPTMRSSTFTYWETGTDRLPIGWDEAKRRIADQERADATGSRSTAN